MKRNKNIFKGSKHATAPTAFSVTRWVTAYLLSPHTIAGTSSFFLNSLLMYFNLLTALKFSLGNCCYIKSRMVFLVTQNKMLNT